MRKILVTTFVLLLGILPLGKILPFRNYPPTSGIASSQVWCIYQDRKGYIWIGCTGGLSRFDGRNFKNYTQMEGLSQNACISMAEDNKGRLWAGTIVGPCLYDDKTDSFKLARDMGSEVRALATYHGSLYCALLDGTLWRLDPDDHWIRIPVVGSNESFTSLTTDGKQLFIGSRKGTIYLLRKKGIVRHIKKINVGSTINNLLFDKEKQTLLIATNNGIYKYNTEKNELSKPIHGTSKYRYFTLVKDNDCSIWAGGIEGLDHFTKRGVVEHFDENSGLIGLPVWSSFIDNEGSLWFGTNHGVSQLSTRLFEIFDKRVGLLGRSIISIAWDRFRNRIWFGTTSGLFYYSKGKIHPADFAANYFKKYYVWSILPHPDGSIWIGTEGGGIVIKKDNRLKIINNKNGLPGNDAIDLFLDSEENVWVATRNGLGKIKSSHVTKFTKKDGLPALYVRCIAKIPGMKGVFLGLIGGGLVYFNGKTFERIGNDRKNDIKSVYDLKWMDKKLWIATTSGLFSCDKNFKLMKYASLIELPNINCSVLEKASKGKLWIGTDGGAALVDIKRMKTVLILTQSNGLPGNEFTTHNSLIRDGKGDFWFGLFGGAVHLNKAILQGKDFTVKPLIRLEKVAISYGKGKSHILQNLRGEILQSNLRYIKFYYNVLNYVAPLDIKAAYKLENFDDLFSQPSNQFIAEYTNLPSGSYEFKVKVFWRGKRIAEKKLASFWVPPNLWQNPILIMLLIIGTILLIFLLFRYKYRKIEREREHLQEKVNQATIELQRKNDLLSRIATTDELTGLFNRRYFLHSLEREVRLLARSTTKKPISLLLLDLDHFKQINDNWGHHVGDIVLQHFAKCIKAAIRSTDIAARFGGEEFVVLLPQTDRNGAWRVAEKIRNLILSNPAEYEHGPINCSVSIGISILKGPFRYTEKIVTDFIKRSDEMMYKAKRDGRNQTVIEPETY